MIQDGMLSCLVGVCPLVIDYEGTTPAPRAVTQRDNQGDNGGPNRLVDSELSGV
jgi:hypothetical protein